MPIVCAAAVPHSPILFPSVGREHRAVLQPTVEALESLAAELAQLKVETMVLVGNHGALQAELFTVVQDPQLTCKLTEFGELNVDRVWPNDLGFSYRLREYAETRLPLVGVSQPVLDYGMGVPAWLLSRYLPQLKLTAVGSSFLSTNEHLDLGDAIRRLAERTTTRYALVAAGDLSHRRPGPAAGGGEACERLDTKIREALERLDWPALSSLNQQEVDEAQASAWRNLLVLAGALRDVAWRGEVRSYQAPFGVGLLTAAFYP